MYVTVKQKILKVNKSLLSLIAQLLLPVLGLLIDNNHALLKPAKSEGYSLLFFTILYCPLLFISFFTTCMCITSQIVKLETGYAWQANICLLDYWSVELGVEHQRPHVRPGPFDAHSGFLKQRFCGASVAIARL